MCLGVTDFPRATEACIDAKLPSTVECTNPDTAVEVNTRHEVQDRGDQQTIVIFDWDDTLLCTSFLAQWEGRQLPAVAVRHLQGIERAAVALLETAKSSGDAFIITNATREWVLHTAAQVMPKVLPLLQEIRIISARDEYSREYPDQMGMWKTLVFLDLQREFESKRRTNLVSLGDSAYEMEATQTMSKQFMKVNVKTVKFQPRPTSEELLKQLQVLVPKFEVIIKAQKSLQIGLERKSPSAARAA